MGSSKKDPFGCGQYTDIMDGYIKEMGKSLLDLNGWDSMFTLLWGYCNYNHGVIPLLQGLLSLEILISKPWGSGRDAKTGAEYLRIHIRLFSSLFLMQCLKPWNNLLMDGA
ncbi:hypothetical protein SAY86_005293 [Trapa natans]|uniref:Uncharacterized protein n=1 Tax=Trapa natans TaxID=22666 RepID=A0AAN7L7N7_TRANT|nr:hypothetical protein SAY86_005293 [Trapa natans]